MGGTLEGWMTWVPWEQIWWSARLQIWFKVNSDSETLGWLGFHWGSQKVDDLVFLDGTSPIPNETIQGLPGYLLDVWRENHGPGLRRWQLLACSSRMDPWRHGIRWGTPLKILLILAWPRNVWHHWSCHVGLWLLSTPGRWLTCMRKALICHFPLKFYVRWSTKKIASLVICSKLAVENSSQNMIWKMHFWYQTHFFFIFQLAR